jgi:peptidoglycan/LPS O-acetylase OafA/YrhL
VKYRPDIDGLRAVAVLPVILFHSGLSAFSGGFVGVDIFFVISGYVIAHSLEDDLKARSFSIWRFYSKRIKRIFPALFATVFLTWLFSFWILLPNFFEGFSKSIMAASTFVSNIYFWKDSGYFSADALSRPLLHTWSLSVEEQYYIFAPMFTYLVYSFFGKRWFIAFSPVLIMSLILSAYETRMGPTANFFLLPTRAWELLIGALLAHAALKPLRSKWLMELVATSGMCLIAWSIFMFTRATPFPGLNALYPCIGACLIIYAGQSTSSLTTKLLSTKPFTGIGKISYSLYLVHWPVIVLTYFITLAPPATAQVLFILAVSFPLAILSWRFVEQPFRHLNARLMQKQILSGGVLAIALFSLIGSIGWQTKGFPSRFPDYKHETIPGSNSYWRTGTCFLENNPDYHLWNYDACLLSTGGDNKVLLWGDSFAAQYVPGIVENKDKIPATIIQYTSAGCPPILSYQSQARPLCTSFNANALKVIRDHDIKTVILAGRWTDLEARGLDQLNSTLSALDKMGVKTYVIGQSPEFSIDVQVLAYAKGSRDKKGVDEWNVFFDPDINRRLALYAGSHTFINPMKALCEGTLCPYRDMGQFLFEDYGHYSVEGSTRAVRAYFPFFASK